MGLVDNIRDEAKKSGSNKSKILYIRDGEKKRIRFLEDMDDGIEVDIHDNWERRESMICMKAFGKPCAKCNDESMRTRKYYCWPVYEYGTESQLLLLYAFNNCSPLPQLLSIYDNFGTITDRDIVIGVTGKQTDKTFSCVHQDKSKFRDTKIKPYSKSAMLKIIAKAYPPEDEPGGEEFEEEKPAKKKSEPMNQPETAENDYESMSAVELFRECVKRKIDCQKRKPEKYYIRLLEEDDQAKDDWGEDENGAEKDEWEADELEGLPFN